MTKTTLSTRSTSNVSAWRAANARPSFGLANPEPSPYTRSSAMHCPGIERLHEEFTQRIRTQTVLPSADTAAWIRSGDTPLNRLIANEPPAHLKCCLWLGFDNTPEGNFVPKFHIRPPRRITMAILITGGAGYIGSHMVHDLADSGEQP